MNALITAHIAGIPVEEWIPSAAATGGCIVLGLREAAHRIRTFRRNRSRGAS